MNSRTHCVSEDQVPTIKRYVQGVPLDLHRCLSDRLELESLGFRQIWEEQRKVDEMQSYSVNVPQRRFVRVATRALTGTLLLLLRTA